jgi:hypothetical protein
MSGRCEHTSKAAQLTEALAILGQLRQLMHYCLVSQTWLIALRLVHNFRKIGIKSK